MFHQLASPTSSDSDDQQTITGTFWPELLGAEPIAIKSLRDGLDFESLPSTSTTVWVKLDKDTAALFRKDSLAAAAEYLFEPEETEVATHSISSTSKTLEEMQQMTPKKHSKKAHENESSSPRGTRKSRKQSYVSTLESSTWMVSPSKQIRRGAPTGSLQQEAISFSKPSTEKQGTTEAVTGSFQEHALPITKTTGSSRASRGRNSSSSAGSRPPEITAIAPTLGTGKGAQLSVSSHASQKRATGSTSIREFAREPSTSTVSVGQQRQRVGKRGGRQPSSASLDISRQSMSGTRESVQSNDFLNISDLVIETPTSKVSVPQQRQEIREQGDRQSSASIISKPPRGGVREGAQLSASSSASQKKDTGIMSISKLLGEPSTPTVPIGRQEQQVGEREGKQSSSSSSNISIQPVGGARSSAQSSGSISVSDLNKGSPISMVPLAQQKQQLVDQGGRQSTSSVISKPPVGRAQGSMQSSASSFASQKRDTGILSIRDLIGEPSASTIPIDQQKRKVGAGGDQQSSSSSIISTPPEITPVAPVVGTPEIAQSSTSSSAGIVSEGDLLEEPSTSTSPASQQMQPEGGQFGVSSAPQGRVASDLLGHYPYSQPFSSNAPLGQWVMSGTPYVKIPGSAFCAPQRSIMSRIPAPNPYFRIPPSYVPNRPMIRPEVPYMRNPRSVFSAPQRGSMIRPGTSIQKSPQCGETRRVSECEPSPTKFPMGQQAMPREPTQRMPVIGPSTSRGPAEPLERSEQPGPSTARPFTVRSSSPSIQESRPSTSTAPVVQDIVAGTSVDLDEEKRLIIGGLLEYDPRPDRARPLDAKPRLEFDAPTSSMTQIRQKLDEYREKEGYTKILPQYTTLPSTSKQGKVRRRPKEATIPIDLLEEYDLATKAWANIAKTTDKDDDKPPEDEVLKSALPIIVYRAMRPYAMVSIRVSVDTLLFQFNSLLSYH